MKKLIRTSMLATAALATLTTMLPAAAQRNDPAFESDRRFCASGRSGMDFNSCMWQMQNQRNGQWNNNSNNRWGNNNNNGWGNNNGWNNNNNNGWNNNNNNGWQNQPPGWRAPPSSLPRLSDMQQRALDNCVLLQRSEQARCRATVLSTVR